VDKNVVHGLLGMGSHLRENIKKLVDVKLWAVQLLFIQYQISYAWTMCDPNCVFHGDNHSPWLSEMLNTQMLFGGLTLKSFQELNSVSSDCTIYILNVTLGGRHAFATMSFIAETFIFLYVGMDALDVDKWKMATTTWVLCFPLEFFLFLVSVDWLLLTLLHHLTVVVCWAVWVNHLGFSVHCWFW
jgi:hypothetical protein